MVPPLRRSVSSMPSSSIKTPVNQRRHDNVAVVALERAGRHFEVACYRAQAPREGGAGLVEPH